MVEAARVEHFFDYSSESSIAGVQSNIGVIVGVFDKGVGLIHCANFEEFKRKCGSKPARHGKTVYWNDWYSAKAFFENAEVNGRSAASLYVINVRHYTDVEDPSTLTAKFGEATLKDGEGFDTWKIRDKHYRVSQLLSEEDDYGGLDEDVSPLSVAIEVSKSNTKFVDLIVYEEGKQLKRWSNLSSNPNDPNFVGKVVVSYDYEVIDLGEGTLPAVTVEPLALTGADSGLAGIVAADFVGSKGENGNVGAYLIEAVLETNMRPMHGIVPWFDAKTYNSGERADKQKIVDYFKSIRVQPISGTPTGLDSGKAADYKNAAGDYSGSGAVAFTDDINGAVMVWPPYVPTDLLGTRDGGQEIYISPAGAKMGLIYAAAGKEWLHRCAAGTVMGRVKGVGKLERETGYGDSDRLEPVGIQVLRSDLGNVFGSHRTYSDHPNFVVESVRYRDNYAIHSINLGTRHLLHDNLTEQVMEDVENMIRNFFYNIFASHPEAFSFKDFKKNVQVSVIGENIVHSEDWNAGILYTRWNVLWSLAIQTIKNYYSHNREQSTDMNREA